MGAALSVLAGITAAARADHGRYLPNTPFVAGGNVLVSAYGNANATEFNASVTQGADEIGKLQFTYDTWTGTIPAPLPPKMTAGGALAGGFFKTNAQAKLKPGFQLAFLQTILTDISGANEWNAANGTIFPDTNNGRTSPAYPNTNLPATLMNPPNPPPALGYQDFPNRVPAQGDQLFIAELGCACLNNTPGADGFREARIMGTFLWGFDVVQNPAGVTARAPANYGTPSNDYLMALTDHFDGNPPNMPAGSSTKWNFNTSACFDIVPEPSALVLVLLGMPALLRSRRRQGVRGTGF